MTYQLVPPDDHRCNIAKKSIQFWKDHFIAVLSGAASISPFCLWYQVILQAEKQLFILRQSNVNKNISSYAHLHHNRYYYSIPFVPIGMEALINNITSQRKTWDEHAVKGWVLGTSDENYRFWRLWVQNTRATRIPGMVFFKHKYISNPTVTAADTVIAVAQNMAEAFKTKIIRHFGYKALTAHSNLQKTLPMPPQTKNLPRIRHNIRPPQK